MSLNLKKQRGMKTRDTCLTKVNYAQKEHSMDAAI
jgi:hypothetical protein